MSVSKEGQYSQCQGNNLIPKLFGHAERATRIDSGHSEQRSKFSQNWVIAVPQGEQAAIGHTDVVDSARRQVFENTSRLLSAG